MGLNEGSAGDGSNPAPPDDTVAPVHLHLMSILFLTIKGVMTASACLFWVFFYMFYMRIRPELLRALITYDITMIGLLLPACLTG